MSVSVTSAARTQTSCTGVSTWGLRPATDERRSDPVCADAPAAMHTPRVASAASACGRSGLRCRGTSAQVEAVSKGCTSSASQAATRSGSGERRTTSPPDARKRSTNAGTGSALPSGPPGAGGSSEDGSGPGCGITLRARLARRIRSRIRWRSVRVSRFPPSRARETSVLRDAVARGPGSTRR